MWLRTDLLKIVGCEWQCILLVLQARNGNDDDVPNIKKAKTSKFTLALLCTLTN